MDYTNDDAAQTTKLFLFISLPLIKSQWCIQMPHRKLDIPAMNVSDKRPWNKYRIEGIYLQFIVLSPILGSNVVWHWSPWAQLNCLTVPATHSTKSDWLQQLIRNCPGMHDFPTCSLHGFCAARRWKDVAVKARMKGWRSCIFLFCVFKKLHEIRWR